MLISRAFYQKENNKFEIHFSCSYNILLSLQQQKDKLKKEADWLMKIFSDGLKQKDIEHQIISKEINNYYHEYLGYYLIAYYDGKSIQPIKEDDVEDLGFKYWPLK